MHREDRQQRQYPRPAPQQQQREQQPAHVPHRREQPEDPCLETVWHHPRQVRHVLQTRQENLIQDFQDYCRRKIVDFMKVPARDELDETFV